VETNIHFLNHLEERLSGTYHRPESHSEYGVVLGHCFTCTRHTGILREAGARLAEAGFHVLRFDFSGNGQSEGVFIESSYTKYITEMESAANFLKAQGAKWLGFAGHSMGAAISVLAGAKIPGIRAICAIAGRLTGMDPSRIFSPDQRRQLQETGRLEFVSRGRHLELDSRFLNDMLSHDMREAVASLKIPLLIVHGSQDEIIPSDQALMTQSINPDHSQIVMIAGADHFFSQPEHRDFAARKIAAWFTRISGKNQRISK
jgi:uncharacterized protein